MTDYLETNGWLYLYSGSDTLKAYCENITIKPIYKSKKYHYEGGINIGIALFKEYIIITAKDIWINTTSKAENYISYLKSWMSANSLNVKVQIDSGGTFFKCDGTNTIFPVHVKSDLGNIEKSSKGNQTIWHIDKLTLEQVGTAS